MSETPSRGAERPVPAPAHRQLVRGSTLGVGLTLLLALAGLLNYFGWKYHARFDWTATRLFSLSEKTLNVLAELDRDIEAVVVMNPADELAEPVQELLTRYEAASRRIRVRVVDPAKNLAEAKALIERYGIQRDNVIVFDRGDDRRVVEAGDLAEYDFSGMQFGQGPEMKGFKGEQAFTSALLELQEQRKPTVRFTTGHGEAQLDDFSEGGLSGARDLLGKDNVDISSWASLGQPAVPAGTDLLVIAGPTARFTEPEVALLRRYLDAGGRLLVLLDPTLGGGGLLETGLEGLLGDFGVRVEHDIVVDPAKAVPFFGAETFFVDTYEAHPATEALAQAKYPVIFPLARSVAPGTAPAGLAAASLLRTSADGWGETDLANLRAVARGEADVAGPVSLGVAVSAPASGGSDPLGEDLEEDSATAGAAAAEAAAPAGERTLRLAVFGDSDFATNGQLANAGNPTLLSNTLNWLVERQALVAIPPKKPEQVRLTLTDAQLTNLFLVVLGLLPALAVASGLAMHLRRRR